MKIIKYFFVGLIAAIVNIGMLYILTDIVGIYYIFSNVLSFILGILINYILSVKFVFDNSNIKNKKIELLVYFIIGLLGLLLDTLIIYLLVAKLNIYHMFSKFISTIIVFFWNYGIRNLFYSRCGGKK